MTWRGLPEGARAWLVLAAVTLLTRAWIFGDPVVNIDEQFYLMVGDRMAHGALPYVDIWDRKPIGLFLIYAFACRVFADAVVGYQVLAAASVLATSRVLFGMARRFAPFNAALAGAATYPAWLLVFGGVGGQSPVFYNLPMAWAAAGMLRLVSERAAGRWTLRGCGVMLLAGIAMQIKYSAVFEGVWFGLTLLWLSWRQSERLAITACKGALWIACALLPTGVALGAYAWQGHGAEFMQANFLSVFGNDTPMPAALGRLAALTFGVWPLLLCAWIVWRRRGEPRGSTPRPLSWLLGWAGAAYLGILIYGVWNDHYLLPLLLPLSVLAGIAFGSVEQGQRLVALVLGLGLVGGEARAAIDVHINGTAGQVARLNALVRPGLGRGCLYVNEDLSVLYQLNRTCLPSRFVFPQHLALAAYHRALGIDQLGELRRVLKDRPAVIVVSTEPDPETLPASRQMLKTALARDYRAMGSAVVGETAYSVWYARGGGGPTRD
jgi:hypothetical protein